MLFYLLSADDTLLRLQSYTKSLNYASYSNKKITKHTQLFVISELGEYANKLTHH